MNAHEISGLIWVGVIGILYFIPAINARSRMHRNRTAITALNLLLGWTMLGWIAALVWSLTDNREVRQ